MRKPTDIHYWKVINPYLWDHPMFAGRPGGHVTHATTDGRSIPVPPNTTPRKTCHCVVHNMPVVDNWTSITTARILSRLSFE